MYTLSNLSLGNTKIDITVLSPWEATKHGLASWSLTHIQKPEDADKNPFLTDALASVFSKLCVHNAYAPKINAHSARVVSGESLDTMIRIGTACRLHRNQDLPADGVLIHKKNAFVVSSAGCPVILASAGDHFIVAHASRDSLIDRGAVMGNPSRPEHLSSVVYSIIGALRKKGAFPSDITMAMLFSINAEDFEHSENHSQYGEYNSALVRYVGKRWADGIVRGENGETFLDLESVFMEQACSVGVRHVWTTNPLSEHRLLAHTRDGRNPLRRNLVIVKRH